MKKKKMQFQKKLTLIKENITDLSSSRQSKIVGAAGTVDPNICGNTQYVGCPIDTCFCAPDTKVDCPVETCFCTASANQKATVCCPVEG